ncbi:MAG: division/cell wall cluster transcriptional repressor MraZ [Anaerolineae bacterium]
MFYGEFEHSIDDKGRMTIPSKFRARLDSGVVITKGIDPCLWLFPADQWAVLSEKASALSITDPTAREFKRQLFGSASDSIPDKQGRINLPSYLREYAQIDKQAVIVGMHDHCEIWNLEQWRERQKRSDNDPEGRAAKFASLRI